MKKFSVLFLVIMLVACCGKVMDDKLDVYVIWGKQGQWSGNLKVENGQLLEVSPYAFEKGDTIIRSSKREVSWISETGIKNPPSDHDWGTGRDFVDGLKISVKGTDKTKFHINTPLLKTSILWQDFDPDKNKRIYGQEREYFIIAGVGNPARGAKGLNSIPLPEIFKKPIPGPAITLPDDWYKHEEIVQIKLSQKPGGQLKARRVSNNDGRLYIQLYCQDIDLSGDADISYGETHLNKGPIDRSIWLSLPPVIGTIDIRCFWEDGKDIDLKIPTTLVETRGSKLYVNGEVYLVKGTLPRELKSKDIPFLQSMSMNTLRVSTANINYLDRCGFMGSIMININPEGKGAYGRLMNVESEDVFLKHMPSGVERSIPQFEEAVKSPYTLAIQTGNELVSGPDPWAEGRLGETKPFDWLDYLLANVYNKIKPMDPMLPVGYSNCCFGYLAPDFLEIYMHNTYLDKDRLWPPIEYFMKLQGCDKRPYMHTEWSANVYMFQPYVLAPSIPVLEKLRAWNIPNRWNTYLEAGTIGGTQYCLYDYNTATYENLTMEELREYWDKGFSDYGIMTYDSKPKLACWELWHLYRDFEIEPIENRPGTLLITYKRNYWARDVSLTLESVSGEKKVLKLDDFSPNSEREISVDVAKIFGSPMSFRWTLEYDTHRGVKTMSTGGCPLALEEKDFLAKLESRETYPFLKELLDAEVLTADGKPAPLTIKEIEREDGLVVAAFKKPNGVTYATAFSYKRYPNAQYPTAETTYDVSFELAFEGELEVVDGMTGEPNGKKVDAEKTKNGWRLKTKVPWLARMYPYRGVEPFEIPVFRITPK